MIVPPDLSFHSLHIGVRICLGNDDRIQRGVDAEESILRTLDKSLDDQRRILPDIRREIGAAANEIVVRGFIRPACAAN